MRFSLSRYYPIEKKNVCINIKDEKTVLLVVVASKVIIILVSVPFPLFVIGDLNT